MGKKQKEFHDKVSVIHDVLSEYGYITSSNDTENAAGKVNRSYHNINLLLKNYRTLDAVRKDLKYSLESRIRPSNFDDTYYEARYNTIDTQLGRIDYALSRIPYLVTPHGNVAYDALKMTYFDPEKLSMADICSNIYNPLRDEMGISSTMYYAYLEKGKNVLSTILFNVGGTSAELWMDLMKILEEYSTK